MTLFCCSNRDNSKNLAFEYCHGSTYGALYLMSRLKGRFHNCIVAFGELERQKIPTFSGECFRGIADGGINRKRTSWSSIDKNSEAVYYSRRFPFSFEECKKYLNEIIKDNENHLKGGWSQPPFATRYSTAHWKKNLLRIRQLRAWDESLFQADFRKELTRWLDAEILYFQKCGGCYAEPKESEKHLKRMQEMRTEIQSENSFQLDKKDKEQILKAYPIVFLSLSKEGFFQIPNQSEFAIQGNLKLGQEINGMATEPQHMKKIEAFIQLQGLSKKVKVISFAALSLERLTR